MDANTILPRMVRLGIISRETSRRQAALALAAKLTQLGDTTSPATLQRKAQAWINGEDKPPALLGVVLNLLDRAREAQAERKAA